jgi:hypothetical protein
MSHLLRHHPQQPQHRQHLPLLLLLLPVAAACWQLRWLWW